MLQVGGEPRANLLPPEVQERVKAAKIRRLLGVLVALSVVVAGGGYSLAALNAAAVEGQVTAAQQKTAGLLAQQQKYSAAVVASSQVAMAKTTETTGAASEVQWAALYKSLAKLLDPGVTIASGNFSSPASWDTPLSITGPWRYPHVAVVTLTLNSSSPTAGADFVQAASALPSYADATVDSIKNTTSSYTTTITLELNSKIYSNRFAKVSQG
jgi:hypothetical protein